MKTRSLVAHTHTHMHELPELPVIKMLLAFFIDNRVDTHTHTHAMLSVRRRVYFVCFVNNAYIAYL